MELHDLEKLLLRKSKWLETKLSEQKELIGKAAETERTYRVEVAKEILNQKSKGTPATIMRDIVRGTKNISDLKYERDVARSISDACREAIRALLGDMNAIQTLISIKKAEMNLR